MPSQQQRNAPVTAPQSTESGPTTTESGPSNSEVQGQMTGPEGGGEAAAPTTTKKGPNNYTMTGPWSLRALSAHSYGHEHYWEKIRDHNLGTSIFMDGGTNLFVRGCTIEAPEADIPNDAPTTDVPAGGEEEPFKRRHEVTAEATFCIWPSGWTGPMDGGQPGSVHVLEKDLAAKKQELVNQGAEERRTLDTSMNNIPDAEDIDEAAAEDAFKKLCALPVTQINAGIRGMTSDKWNRVKSLITEKPDLLESHARFVAGQRKKVSGAAATNDELKTYFDLMPDADVYALQEIMSLRFKAEIGGREGGAWTADGLRRAWGILERLPPEHVEGNDSLDLLLRDNADAGSGYYWSVDQGAVIGYGDDLEETGGYGAVMVGGTDVGLHTSVNLFDTVLRHEIGHAVDAKMGVSSGYAASTESAGAWKEYGGADAFVTAVIGAADNGMDDYTHPEAYEAALRKAIAETKDFDTALTELRDAGTIAADVPDYAASGTGPVDILRTPNLWANGESPWYNQANRPGVGGRRWHEAYAGSFVSYVAASYEANAVSAYQFRAPGEWFAEAYACFYSDHPDVNGKEAGTSLQGRDSDAYNYIKNNVDNGHSFTEEVPAATEGGGTTSDTSDGLTSAPS